MTEEINRQLYQLCKENENLDGCIRIQIDTKNNSFQGNLSIKDFYSQDEFIKLTESWVGNRTTTVYKVSYILKTEITSLSYRVDKFNSTVSKKK